jgi:hypothetical protein
MAVEMGLLQLSPPSSIHYRFIIAEFVSPSTKHQNLMASHATDKPPKGALSLLKKKMKKKQDKMEALTSTHTIRDGFAVAGSNSEVVRDTPIIEGRSSHGKESAPIKSEPIFKTKEEICWTCNHCRRECIPVRGESRCLCGHRYKEHKKGKFGCERCKCRHFFFVVAEGAWILRCECKHKHIDHDPINTKCVKPGCKSCTGFFSPWVCNCGCKWVDHTQGTNLRKLVVIDGKEFPASLFAQMLGEETQGGIAPEINSVQRDPDFGKRIYGHLSSS